MVTEGLLGSLRPPDRDPLRLGSLSEEQEAVVVAVLDLLAFDGRSACRELTMQVLEEYWVPNALYRRRPATGWARHMRVLAVLLSLCFPGAGRALIGAFRRGLAWAIGLPLLGTTATTRRTAVTGASSSSTRSSGARPWSISRGTPTAIGSGPSASAIACEAPRLDAAAVVVRVTVLHVARRVPRDRLAVIAGDHAQRHVDAR